MGTSRVSKMVLGQQTCDFLDYGGHPPNRRRRDNKYQNNDYGAYGMPSGFTPHHGGWPPQPWGPIHGGSGGGHVPAGPLPGRGGGGGGSRATGSRSRASRGQQPSQSARRGGGTGPFIPPEATAFLEAQRNAGGPARGRGGRRGAGRGWPTPRFIGGAPPFGLAFRDPLEVRRERHMRGHVLGGGPNEAQFGGPYGGGHPSRGGHTSRGSRLGRGGSRGGIARGGSAHRSRAARDPYASEGY